MTISEAKNDFFDFVNKNLSGNIYYESNFDKIPDDEQFMRVYCLLLTGIRSGIGTNHFRRQGNLIIAVFTPINKGSTPHSTKVENCLNILQKYSSNGRLSIGNVYANDLGKDPNADLVYTNVVADFFFEGDTV